ncbi:SDR family NAD(P)-dependent oxidoreductase [Salisaeta longa]|uniref:SDR family NAD(P)-dependent oxidoreductase n=1 Tax=Salisaeta longa TaxID=503170 RepID=UPI0003B7B3FF|nr:SDR family oxidoreductase [Salisaeta longa]
MDTALITGASSGIGAALARCFAADGSDVIVLARSEDALNEQATELSRTHGVQAEVLVADLARPDATAHIVDTLDARGLSPDVLVNNAGFGLRGPFATLDAEQQADMVQVNVTALTTLTRALLPAMQARGTGGVLNVASTAAFQPGPYMAVYYATKAYVLSFSAGLAEEVAADGLTVSCLCPGPTDTSFIDKAKMQETALFQHASVMTPEAVAAAGYRGFRRGQRIVVPGAANKAGAVLAQLTPRRLSAKVAGWLQRD